jgi:hypothetical protein
MHRAGKTTRDNRRPVPRSKHSNPVVKGGTHDRACNLGLVVGQRRRCRVVYALYDHHGAELLDQALYHVEQLQLKATQDAPTSDR